MVSSSSSSRKRKPTYIEYGKSFVKIYNKKSRGYKCPNNMNGMIFFFLGNMNGMIDAAKYADAVIFLIDAGYGFEMVMGVLTYLDTFKNTDMLANTRPRLMDQFQTEICEGAKVFCLSGGLDNGMYLEHEIGKLASYISTMEFHPLSWRAARPYMLVDHLIDITPQETIEMEKECPRDIILKGYLRGCHIAEGAEVHIAGVGDFLLARVTSLADPFPLTSMENECLRAGTYVSFEFHAVPVEMVINHDPRQPILVGGISIEEENAGQIKVKLERHSWHLKLLKSKDPIIVSVGWRRYQTSPIYALKGRHHGRYRLLRRTPKNKPCVAMFWGPCAPPNTALAVVQSLADNEAAFRFLAKAVVVDVNQAAQIVTKRKRIGTPCKISKNTAYIKDMFTSDLQIANLKDAKIQTTSGIYGKINKPAGNDLIDGLESKDGQLREGIAECTFKRKIRKSDSIFMHVYEKVEVPRFFNTITTSPEPPDRIWETSAYIDPSEPKDHELGLRWATERQFEELRVEDDKRRRERTSTLRRQTLSPRLIALPISLVLELKQSQKKQKKTEVLISEDHREDEGLMKGFENYLKEKGLVYTTS
ncbi:hypothetical protein MKW94_021344 [Papaver nudicaule]|uniref:Ribosome biogenesis protein BMS1/TSR1 C-terminal domain-containing protein n=1 Tax=Papaver nudicaule TaxID=74823 RepID=A0AA41UUX7_PAPNU|nr:hypothetical protein [Papaver nudicaule]